MMCLCVRGGGGGGGFLDGEVLKKNVYTKQNYEMTFLLGNKLGGGGGGAGNFGHGTCKATIIINTNFLS